MDNVEYMRTRIEGLALTMWDHYCHVAGGVTFDGKPLPKWEELGEDRQKCWKGLAQLTLPDMLFQEALHGHNVSNWEGYSEAVREFNVLWEAMESDD